MEHVGHGSNGGHMENDAAEVWDQMLEYACDLSVLQQCVLLSLLGQL